MFVKRNLGFLFIILLLIGQAGCQDSIPVKPDLKVSAYSAKTSTNNPVQEKINQYLHSKKINGNIAIVKDNQIIYNTGIGYANFQKKIVNKPDTTYPIGSITKSMVATSIMQLQEKGLLNIQDPVSKYLPNFPNGKRIKLVHLLTHTSGIRALQTHFGITTPEILIKKIQNRPIEFPAGTKWDYTDENYAVLGYILEKVAGTPLHKYIQKNIFVKAGMKHSGFITKKNPEPYRAVGYYQIKNNMLSIKKIHDSLLFGYADIYSTAKDICLYDMALMNGRLVSKGSLKEIVKPGSKSIYGLGLYNSGKAIYSRGVLEGWEALHAYYPDNTSITVLLNVRNKDLDIHQVSSDIFKIVRNT